ncbi:hypothetical protein Sgou_23270 [Streptomyces gougerotii]|uniref:Uncharacterized protein n=1 Tax=Streptomyces gougerotii TaxID=53448 RepID=A0A8H9HLM5_9ACTN|nr:hypothetical protein Sgou_23270 [Streptomyces gougerotii]GGU72458.1 hypothetical protein GCM10010227_28530 [Streptomyces gougerotii]
MAAVEAGGSAHTPSLTRRLLLRAGGGGDQAIPGGRLRPGWKGASAASRMFHVKPRARSKPSLLPVPLKVPAVWFHVKHQPFPPRLSDAGFPAPAFLRRLPAPGST